MRCPNCGNEVGRDVLFCPSCGQNISRRSHRKLRFILMDVQDDRRFRHLASAAVIAVVIVAVIAVLLAMGTPWSNDAGEGNIGPSDDAIIISDTDYIELGGCFDDGDMSASLDGGRLVIRLSDSASSGFDGFTWILRDEFLNRTQTITKTAPDLTWVSPYIGVYTVTVSCTSSQTGESSVYTGTIEYRGDVRTQYSFYFEGENYTVYVDVPYAEYRHYSSDDAAYASDRAGRTAESGCRFITTDGAVGVLAQRLTSEYLDADPSASVTDQRFADYILSFVQSCMVSGSDTFYNSTSTYWAFPSETLYTGAGDSGDLSVLAASLLRACGYDAGIAVIHNHAFVTLTVDGFTEPEAPYGYHVLVVRTGNVSTALTDVSGGPVPLGCVGEGYGYSNGRFTYYGQDASADSGMAHP